MSNIAIREVGEIQDFIEHIDLAGSLAELGQDLILSCQHIQNAYLQIKSGDQYLPRISEVLSHDTKRISERNE